MKKIIVDDAIPFLEGRLENYFTPVVLHASEIDSEAVKDADAPLVRTRTRCDAPLLEGSNVEFIGTCTIGMDHFCRADLDRLGIEAVNAPGCNAPAVAQYAWSSLLRMGFDPARHTLGLVGKGNVGKVVAAWGRLLGARVIVSDPPRAEAGLSDEDYLPLSELARQCDAITFHVPLTREGKHRTLGLGSREVISQLRPGALLVNAARGGVVDEDAVADAIEEKGLVAAIDTWVNETGMVSPRLLRLVRYGTPHIAGYSRQGKERATRMVLEALGAHFSVDLPVDGLSPAYVLPEALTAKEITDSYDPAVDTALLRSAPDSIDRLRNAYRLREEV